MFGIKKIQTELKNTSEGNLYILKIQLDKMAHEKLGNIGCKIAEQMANILVEKWKDTLLSDERMMKRIYNETLHLLTKKILLEDVDTTHKYRADDYQRGTK